MRTALTLIAVAGCAQGGSRLADDAALSDADQLDAVDALVDAPIDGRLVDAPPPADAPPPVDAFVPQDACVPATTQLLINPAFDLSPLGIGWQETRIDPGFPLVTGDDGISEHSAPYKAWLGGFEASAGSATDVLWQDLMIPADTTQLVITGSYEVRTGETSSTIVYDSAQLAITQIDGTPIQIVRALSNLTPTTTWTAFSHTFAQNLAGQTVRVRMTSSNDFLNATSFYFDTLALTATHCP